MISPLAGRIESVWIHTGESFAVSLLFQQNASSKMFEASNPAQNPINAEESEWLAKEKRHPKHSVSF